MLRRRSARSIKRAIIGVAFADIEFAANDIVARPRIAANIDALDINARALFDGKRQIDDLGLKISLGLGLHRGEGIAALGSLDRQAFDGLLDLSAS